MEPLISVIFPAYNVERYIRSSIESILAQTFTDFELILIDDGSKDNTAAIIREFTDPRIRFVQNEQNSGLAFTLNKGIDLARGKYIARMDGDDLSLPERFAVQVTYLDAHPEVAMIDTVLSLIDENGNDLHGVNSPAIHYDEIVRTMPKYNCLGHSSIMIRSEVLRAFRYKDVGTEDYDLWLRMIADGQLIHKLEQPPLLYRIHSSSYTKSGMITGVHFNRQARSKLRFVLDQVFGKKRISGFVLRVLFYTGIDYATAWFKMFKRWFRLR